jgi:hypothetical protein
LKPEYDVDYSRPMEVDVKSAQTLADKTTDKVGDVMVDFTGKDEPKAVKALDKVNRAVTRHSDEFYRLNPEVQPFVGQKRFHDLMDWSTDHNLVHWLGTTTKKQRRGQIKRQARRAGDWALNNLDQIVDSGMTLAKAIKEPEKPGTLRLDSGKRQAISAPYPEYSGLLPAPVQSNQLVVDPRYVPLPPEDEIELLD